MKKKILTGLLIGLIAGIIDVIPMIIQKLPWNANLSALTLWIVTGLFLGITSFKVKGILKGLIIAFLILLPNLFIIGLNDPLSLIPVFAMTLILGSLSGFTFEKIIKE
jgi:hypothetical protein